MSTINKAMINSGESTNQLVVGSIKLEDKINEALKLLNGKRKLSSFDKKLISILK